MTPGSLPATLAERPVDPGSGLPIPFVNEQPDGGHDFSTINGRRSIQCALSRICGMCGRTLGYDIAFLGDARAAETSSYTQPPMHVACAEAALRLCPHLAGPGPASALVGGNVLPLRPTDGRQERAWTLLIANSFEIERPADRDGERLLVFHPGAPVALRQFRFVDGALEEEVT